MSEPTAPAAAAANNNNNNNNNTPPVWVQLYYKGKVEPEGDPIKIKPIPDDFDIDDLKTEVKVKRAVALNHCDAADLWVYPPSTNGADGNHYKPGEKLKELVDDFKKKTPPISIDENNPLIVVAPKQKQGDQLHDEEMRVIAEFARAQMLEAETLVFSKVKSDIYREVTGNLGLKVKGAIWDKRPSDLPDVGRFTWFMSKEDSEENRNGYMKYLRENISWPGGYAVTDCNEYKDLLSMPDFMFDGKHKTSGNIDVVLAAQEDVKNCVIRQNIRAGLELNKNSNKGKHENQVVLQHLAASSLNPNESVLTVMTDLNDRWHFYWFGKERGRMYKVAVDTRGEANFLFEHMFDSPNSVDSSILFPTEFLVRGTWRVFSESDLEKIRETRTDDSGDGNLDSGHSRHGGSGYSRSHGNDQGGKKDDSKGGVARRQQLAGNNYGMDVANELELLDFVGEEEKRAIQLRYLAEHVIPMMAYVPEQNRHNTEGEGYCGLSEANLSFHNASRSR